MQALSDCVLAALRCPRDRTPLTPRGAELRCARGCAFPVVDGIPILLLPEARPTHPEFTRALQQPAASSAMHAEPVAGVDPFVQSQVGATNGPMYQPLVGRLTRYPIPDLRLEPGSGLFLDIGCNWGRWSVAAARLGYSPLGIDPSLPAVRAATRVARQLGVDAAFVVADSRHLPVASSVVDVAWSYSVLQHLPKADVRQALREIRRVLSDRGRSIIQLPNRRAAYAAFKRMRNPSRPTGFDVRFWTPQELQRTFGRLVGPTALSVDGFFTLDSQAADIPLLPIRYRAVVRASEILRRTSARWPWLVQVAESLTVTSEKGNGPRTAAPAAS